MNRRNINSLTAFWQLRILLLVSLIWLAPTIACGSFAPRPTATPTLPPVVQQPPTQVTEGEPEVEALATQLAPGAVADTATPAPTATFTPTPLPGTALSVGQQARVTAPAGLNFRDVPSTDGQLLGQLGTGQLVNLIDGPVEADGFTWWQMDDRQGNVGWGAEGDDETVWLSPQIGEPQPVNRPPAVGDRVAVTMGANAQLTVRSLPGTDAPQVTRVNPGREFTVLAGPQQTDGYTWYQIRSDDGSIEGWAADGDGVDRWLSPLE